MNTDTLKRPVLVVGAGVIGLTTAIRLREAGHDVTILTRETPSTLLNRADSPMKGTRPSAYTSFASGGLWAPCGLGDTTSQGWAAKTFEVFKTESESDCGVTMVEGYAFHQSEKASAEPWFAALTPVSVETADSDGKVPAIYKSAYKYIAPIVDMERYLAHLESLAVQKGIVIELASELSEVGDAADWAHVTTFVRSRFQGQKAVVVNCCGVGAEDMHGEKMQPVRGVSVWVKKPPNLAHFFVEEKESSDALQAGFCNFGAPHGEEYVLGASGTENSLAEAVDEQEVQAVLSTCEKMIPGISSADVIAAKAGLRPVASTGEIQIGRRADASTTDLEAVENYGHAGHGVTLCWGCAEVVADVVGKLETKEWKEMEPGFRGAGVGVGL